MTFREKPISKLYAFALAAVFALTLAGCGGGGGTAAVEEEPPPMPTPQEMCESDGGRYNADGTCTSAEDLATEREANALAAAKAAAMTAYEAAKTALAAVTDDASHDMDSYGKAEEAVAEAKAANAVAQAATTSAAAEDAQALAETAQANAEMYAGMVTAAATKAAARVAQEAENKVAGTKGTAIAAEGTQTTDAGLGGSDAPAPTAGQVAGEYNLDIKHDGGQVVTITIEGATEDDNEVIMANDMGMHVRTHDADDDGNVMEEVVVVRTDIEAPKAVEFAKFEVMAADGTVTTPQELNVSTDTTNDTPTATNEALGIVGGNLGMVKASAFTAPAGTVGTTVLSFQQAVADDASTTDVDESRDAAELAGTFNGSMGTYKCNATAACTVTVNAMGVVSAVSNDSDWVFIPATGATTDQPDYDYYHYGFWLKKTTDEDGVLTYNEVETFAGSSVNASGDVATVTGSATYEGGAVGVYVKNVYNSDRTLDVATSGHFTADVSLTATFGQVNNAAGTGTIAPDKLNTLTGTIDNFALSGGEDNDWSVALQSDGDPNAAGIQADSDGTMAGTAKGGDGDGSFTAIYHGSLTAAADGTIPKPGSVVGEFNAGFTDGTVAGAFGARRVDN